MIKQKKYNPLPSPSIVLNRRTLILPHFSSIHESIHFFCWSIFVIVYLKTHQQPKKYNNV